MVHSVINLLAINSLSCSAKTLLIFLRLEKNMVQYINIQLHCTSKKCSTFKNILNGNTEKIKRLIQYASNNNWIQNTFQTLHTESYCQHKTQVAFLGKIIPLITWLRYTTQYSSDLSISLVSMIKSIIND